MADQSSAYKLIPRDKISPNPNQPRKRFLKKRIEELADSMRAEISRGNDFGLINPITVRKIDGEYQIVSGENRWRAAGLAGIEFIPCLIRDYTDDGALAHALSENLQRYNNDFLEVSDGVRNLRDSTNESASKIAAMIGVSRTRVQNILSLQSLSTAVKQYLESNIYGDEDDFKLNGSHAEELVKLPPGHQLEYARKAVTKRWTVKSLRKGVTEALRMLNGEFSDDAEAPDVNIVRLGESLAEWLGCPFEVKSFDSERVVFNIGLSGFTLLNEQKYLQPPYEVKSFSGDTVLVATSSKAFDSLAARVEEF